MSKLFLICGKCCYLIITDVLKIKRLKHIEICPLAGEASLEWQCNTRSVIS